MHKRARDSIDAQIHRILANSNTSHEMKKRVKAAKYNQPARKGQTAFDTFTISVGMYFVKFVLRNKTK
jgi:hypothetical protein